MLSFLCSKFVSLNKTSVVWYQARSYWGAVALSRFVLAPPPPRKKVVTNTSPIKQKDSIFF